MSHNKKIKLSSSLQEFIELRSPMSLDKTSAISLNLQDSFPRHKDSQPRSSRYNSKRCTQRKWNTSIATFHIQRFECFRSTCCFHRVHFCRSFPVVSHQNSHILVTQSIGKCKCRCLRVVPRRTSVPRSPERACRDPQGIEPDA